MVTLADEEAVTVTIRNIDYENKMLLMLSDKSIYQIFHDNPLEKMLKYSKELLKHYNKKSYFHNGAFQHKYHIYKFTQTDNIISRIYGLEFKLSCPFHPVVFSINSPTFFFC